MYFPLRAAALLLAFLFPAAGHSQFSYQWAACITGSGEAFIDDMDEDAQGNIYIIGRINGTVDFDPGPAAAPRTSTGNMDFFLAKYDANGGFIWANVAPGGFSGWGMMPFNIRVAQNSVYVAGTFIGNCDFDPGPGVASLSAIGNLGPFFGRYDLNGNYQWINTVGSQNNDHATGIDVDAAGNVYVSFVSGGTAVDFDPGPGVAPLAVNVNDGVFAKYDNAGNYIFAKSFTSTGGGWHPCMDIAVDNASNIYVTGLFDGPADMDPNGGTVMVNPTGVDGYIAKYDATGAYLWHGQYAGTADDIGATLRMDQVNNTIYNGGYFSSPVLDLDPGAGTANINSSGTNGFISKFDAAGGYLWGVNVDGNQTDVVQDIDLDSCQNVYVAGYFNSSALDLDPGPATTGLSATGAEDVFFAKYTSGGTFLYAGSIGGPATDVAGCLSVNAANRNLSVGGYFNQIMDTDPGPGAQPLTAGGANNGFLSSYSENPPQPVDITPPANLSICPGDSTLLIVAGSAAGTVYWYDLSGNLVGIGDSLFTGPIGGTVTFIFQDSIACLPASFPDSITVNVGNINVSITASDSTLCAGEATTLNGSGAVSYLWTPGGSAQATIVVSPAVTTTYMLTGQAGNCADSASITIFVDPLPVLGVQGDTAICSGNTAQLTASGASSYLWSPGGETAATITVTPAATTVYTVAGTNGTCTDSVSVTVNVLNNLVVSLGPDTLVCDTSTLQLSGGAGQSYQWNTGETTQSVSADTTGLYIEVITDSTGCSGADSIFVQYALPPQFALDTVVICEGDSAFFAVSFDEGTTYLWQNGSADTSAWTADPGHFWLQETNICGTETDSGFVIIQPAQPAIVLPDIFTPDGDGTNDQYYVSGAVLTESFRMDIYNRWGRLMFSSADPAASWDGSGDNGTVTAGTYFIVFTYRNCQNEEKKTHGLIEVIAGN